MSEVAASIRIAKELSFVLREFRWELVHALNGESRYKYVLAGYEDGLNKLITGSVFAANDLEAVSQVAKLKSDFVIRSIRPANNFVSIKLLVAYPCRLVRFIFAHVKRKHSEANHMNTVLLLQSRQALVKHIDGKGCFISWPSPANAAVFSAIPEDNAKAPSVVRDVINRQDHQSVTIVGDPLMNGKLFTFEKSETPRAKSEPQWATGIRTDSSPPGLSRWQEEQDQSTRQESLSNSDTPAQQFQIENRPAQELAD